MKQTAILWPGTIEWRAGLAAEPDISIGVFNVRRANCSPRPLSEMIDQCQTFHKSDKILTKDTDCVAKGESLR